MKKLALVLLAIGTLLSGCVAYEPAPRYHDYGYRDRAYRDHSYRDRDRDGVPNRQDRYPRDPRYY